MDLNVRGGAAQITGVSMRRVNGRVRLSSMSFFLATAFWCAGANAQTLVHFDLPAQPNVRPEPEVIERALEQIPGRAIVNSVNLEAGRDKLDRVVPMALAHGAALIALTALSKPPSMQTDLS